jgi:hydroxyacylglutathione hydrolase
MRIEQFRYSSDNLGYLIYLERNAVAVDGGAVDDILSFIRANDINLRYVVNTHSHGDHTVGNSRLLRESVAGFIGYKELINNGLELDNEPVHVYKTPGHTADSVIFHVGNNLITGDTLFIGKVGRCFSGDVMGFLKSVKLIMGLPPDTVFYPGHDYVEEYMDFIKGLEPDNRYVDEFLKRYNPDIISSTIEEELKLNPFLRFNQPEIVSLLKERGLPVDNELDRWRSMLSLM